MSKQAQTELVLFPSSAPIQSRFLDGVVVKPTFAKDKDGNKTDRVTVETIKLLPRSSKDHPDLKDASGLTGQALFAWESEARRELLAAAQTEFTNRIASGNFTFDTFKRNLRTGKLTFAIKPEYKKSATGMSDAELAAEVKARGLVLATKDGKVVADVEAPVIEVAAVQTENPALIPAPAPAKPNLNPKKGAKK